MKFTSRIISNTFYLFLDWSIVSLLSLLFWVVVNKSLNSEQVGIVFTFTNTTSFLASIAIFGFSTALFKLIPEYTAKKQFKKISSLIKFSIKIVILILLAISMILVLFSNQFSSALKINQITYAMLIVTTIIITISSIFTNVLFGFQDFKKNFKADAYGNIVKLFMTILLLYLGLSYFGVLITLMLSFFVILLFRLDMKFFKGGDDGIDKKRIILDYTLPAFISAFALAIFSNGHYIVLTTLKNLDVTGKYGVAMSLASQIALIPTILTSALFPITSQLNATKNFKRKQSHLINLVLKYILLIGFPITSFLILFSRAIILIYSKLEFLSAAQLFPILAIGSLIYGIGTTYLSSLYAIGKTKIYRNILVFSALIFLFLSIALTYLYSSLGLSVAYTASVSLLSILSYYFIRKYLKVTLNFKLLIKIIFSNLVFILLSVFIDIIPTILYLKIILIGIAGIIYLLILVPLKFYTKDDVEILTFFESRSPKSLRKVFSVSKQIISKHI